MKRMKYVVAMTLALLLIFSFAVTVSADTFVTLDGISFYTNESAEAVIVDYDDSSSRLDIPGSMLGAKVTQIAPNSFYADSVIREVSFAKADSLRVIGSNAFCGCSALTSVELPCLEELGFGAFQDCFGLKSVSISEGLRSIPEQAFYNCKSLETVAIAASVTSICDYAFGNCKSLAKIEIPATVIKISATAFYGCDKPVIICHKGSAAHLYAHANGIPFELLDSSKIDISGAKAIPEETAVRYDGKAQCPSVSVTYGDITLTENTDYAVEYLNNTEVGTATVHIIGRGGYEGDLYAEFAVRNVLGDADGDGKVSIIDATRIRRRLAEITVSLPERVDLVGNVSKSGRLNIIDATAIQRWLADFETYYAIDSLMD